MSRVRPLAAGLAFLLVVACGGELRFDPDQPPTIAYGEEVCHRCGMSIDAPDFAAALRRPDGAELHFDDVGELMLALAEGELELDGALAWVFAVDTGSWVKADAARFVREPEVISPMGFGIRAYASEAPAGAVPWDEMAVGRP